MDEEEMAQARIYGEDLSDGVGLVITEPDADSDDRKQ